MKNEYLRHTVATISYRFQKSVKDCEDSFGHFNLGKGSRSTNEIINHMCEVLTATRIFIEKERFEKVMLERLSLTEEIERFNLELKSMDNTLSGPELGIDYAKKLLQGPFSDILTHIGQIAMMQRINNKPIDAEDFSAADIRTGLK
ncbi:hypothetical protein QQ020_14985 [Fulvivirgaceae bacterium BMA12]|uniref:DinB family protein n=1 Tax=Agaribacillus aureus TaxID=3051825 RepID=A0ABT8L6J4_9BACT|nr:hypothetical protein [Fulvivirgaceae bacterium BMA12]